MPTVEQGDIVLFSQRGVARHLRNDFTFVQMKDILSPEERADWYINFNTVCRMGVIAKGKIYVATVEAKSIGILDLALNRIDTFNNPYLGAVICLAYANDVLYVLTHGDYDEPLGGQREFIAAYDIDTMTLLWRNLVPINTNDTPPTSPTTLLEGQKRFNNAFGWIAIDGSTLYFTQAGWAAAKGVGGTSFTQFINVDGQQPDLWDDDINDSYPPGAFPDTSKLVHQPGPPHALILKPGPDGNLIIAREETTWVEPISLVERPDVRAGQFNVRINSIAVNGGKVYLSVSQPTTASQVRNIVNYPTAPFFYAIFSNFYSTMQRVDVYSTAGGYQQTVKLPIPGKEGATNHHRTGYLFGTDGQNYFNNEIVSTSVDPTYVWTVQRSTIDGTGFGVRAGPVSRIKKSDNSILWKTDDEIVPASAYQQLNGAPDQNGNRPFFIEEIPTLVHILPIQGLIIARPQIPWTTVIS